MAEHHTYHAVFYQWWQQTFPHSDHSYYPTGIGGVGSHYFANCFFEHIPAEVDLVIVDSAVNDQRLDDQHRSFDMLLRSLLALPSAPAVIDIEFFPISSISPLTTGGTNQLDSSRYLDVPSHSIRNPLLPELLLYPSRIPSFFGRLPMSAGGIVDGRHPGLRGHLAAANILKHHVWQQILFVEAHNTEEDVALEKLAVSRIGIVDEKVEGVYDPSERVRTEEENQAWQIDRTFLEEEDWGMRNEELEVVPRMSLLDRFHPSSFIPPSVPRCRSLSGTREKLVLLSATRGDRVENGTTYPGEGDGWFEWHSPPHKQYVISRSPKARATFNITVGAGDVKIWYLKSSTFGLGIWEHPHNIGMMDQDGNHPNQTLTRRPSSPLRARRERRVQDQHYYHRLNTHRSADRLVSIALPALLHPRSASSSFLCSLVLSQHHSLSLNSCYITWSALVSQYTRTHIYIL